MQTPIQKLIAELEDLRSPYVVNSGAWQHYSTAIQAAKNMLEEEKSEIKQAFSRGYYKAESAETYYESNYKNNEDGLSSMRHIGNIDPINIIEFVNMEYPQYKGMCEYDADTKQLTTNKPEIVDFYFDAFHGVVSVIANKQKIII
jgi:hypothetical protein